MHKELTTLSWPAILGLLLAAAVTSWLEIVLGWQSSHAFLALAALCLFVSLGLWAVSWLLVRPAERAALLDGMVQAFRQDMAALKKVLHR